MLFYLTTSGTRELTGLSAKQRGVVKRECVFPLFRRSAFRVGSSVVAFCSSMLGIYLAEFWKLGFWGRAVTIGASVLILGYLYDRIWLACHRQEVARYIHEHAAEIEGAP